MMWRARSGPRDLSLTPVVSSKRRAKFHVQRPLLIIILGRVGRQVPSAGSNPAIDWLHSRVSSHSHLNPSGLRNESKRENAWLATTIHALKSFHTHPESTRTPQHGNPPEPEPTTLAALSFHRVPDKHARLWLSVTVGRRRGRGVATCS